MPALHALKEEVFVMVLGLIFAAEAAVALSIAAAAAWWAQRHWACGGNDECR